MPYERENAPNKFSYLDRSIDELDKEQVKILTELHKQNADYIKTVTASLTALMTVFGVAAAAVFTASYQAIPGIFASSSTQAQGISPIFTPYLVFGVMLFQNLLLREIRRKSGYQQFLEERLNILLKGHFALWESDIGLRSFLGSPSNTGFQLLPAIVLLMALYNGVLPHITAWIDYDPFLSLILHGNIQRTSLIILLKYVSPHIVLLFMLMGTFKEIKEAKDKTYADSVKFFTKAEGIDARNAGLSQFSCPYDAKSLAGEAWKSGFEGTQDEPKVGLFRRLFPGPFQFFRRKKPTAQQVDTQVIQQTD